VKSGSGCEHAGRDVYLPGLVLGLANTMIKASANQVRQRRPLPPFLAIEPGRACAGTDFIWRWSEDSAALPPNAGKQTLVQFRQVQQLRSATKQSALHHLGQAIWDLAGRSQPIGKTQANKHAHTCVCVAIGWRKSKFEATST